MKVSILGCGWLGFPLARRLVEIDHEVKGSTTSPDKVTKLTAAGIRPYLLSVSSEGIEGDISQFLKETGILIINFPPSSQRQTIGQYLQALQDLVKAIEGSNIKKILFASSISVYQDSKDFPVYTEKDRANGTSERAQGLIEAENLFKNQEGFSATILRLGGLIGGDRHPVKHLAGRGDIANPQAPVNLIHQDDCIGIIQKIIQKDAFGEVFNAVSPEHPSKEYYYSNKAKEKKLSVPEFAGGVSKGKIISSEKVISSLGYQFTTKI